LSLTTIQQKGNLFELGFAFGVIPLVVSTMDARPLMLGGRILLWSALFLLLSLHAQRDGGKLRQILQENRKRGTLPALALLLGLGSLLQFGLGRFGLWQTPPQLASAGPWASLLLLVIATVTTAVPMEVLLRAYLPRRFPTLRPALLGALLTPWFYLCTWNVQTVSLALAGGAILAILSRTKLPFWMLPVLHGLGAWAVQFVHLP